MKYINIILVLIGSILMGTTHTKFILESRDFENNSLLPEKFTINGQKISPELHWSGAPAHTKSFAVIMEDPDAPSAEPFVHWIVFNIPDHIIQLPPNFTQEKAVQENMVFGLNTGNKATYYPPSPPPGKPHRYIFTLYALDTVLPLGEKTIKQELMPYIHKHILAKTALTGLYQNKKENKS